MTEVPEKIEDLTDFVKEVYDIEEDRIAYIYVRVGNFEISTPIIAELTTVLCIINQLSRPL